MLMLIEIEKFEKAPCTIPIHHTPYRIQKLLILHNNILYCILYMYLILILGEL